MKNTINHYAIAIATGLTPEQAKFYELAMTREDAPDLNHLRIIK